MNAKIICIDQHWAEECTNYWFDVNGENYAVSDCNGVLRLLDCDGCPVEACNDHGGLLEILTPLIPAQ